jgi:cytoskeleton protein RodZ
MNQPDAEPAGDPGSQTPPRPHSPGAQLLAERRSQGLSLGDIARQLKLSVRQVEALERDEYGSFQGSVFVRGFLRNYAKLLRLDPERLVEAAGASVAPAMVAAPASGEVQVPAPNPEQRRRILAWGALAALVVLVLILLASNASKEQRDAQVAQEPPTPAAQAPSTPQHAESPPPMSQAPAAPVPASTSPAAPVPAAPPTERKSVAGTSPTGSTGAAKVESPVAAASGSPHPASSDWPHAGISAAEETVPAAKPRVLVIGSGSSRIRMIFEDESWVEVRDGNGATIFSRLNAPGTERVVRGMPPFVVVVGNAHRVKLLYEDKPIDLGPHTRVDVARITLE